MDKEQWYRHIVGEAWKDYDSSREPVSIEDISAKVSTNHVYRINFPGRKFIVAKLTHFGTYQHFVEDHTIINSLSNNLPYPFENFLARSLMKKDRLYTYHYQGAPHDAWVVFYRPISIQKRLPKRLTEEQVEKLAVEIAQFHSACHEVRHTLSRSSKTMRSDIDDLVDKVYDGRDPLGLGSYSKQVLEECDRFYTFHESLDWSTIPSIPVFLDWNIGNFSVTRRFRFYSRWDYDWFRMSTRMLDFYFFARVVSDVGDKTVFTYEVDRLMEERFFLFLRKYHQVSPLEPYEIEMLPHSYRFFLLNYVVKYGNYFFNDQYARKLRKEVLQIHLPSIKDRFDIGLLRDNTGI